MKLAESILELFYPSTCPGCGNHTSLKNLWCEKCIRQFWNPHNGRVELKHAFPPLLTAFPWWERLKEYETVIPIPLSKARFRERGYNQVDMIFRKWVETSGKTYIPHGMVRMRNTETQSLLTKEERYKNMRGVFHVNKGTSVKGKKILLADDIRRRKSGGDYHSQRGIVIIENPVREKNQSLYRIF